MTTLIYGELVGAKDAYEELLEVLVQDDSFEWTVKRDRTLQLVASLSKGPSLEQTKENSHRLNLLPKPLSEQIARGISMTELCARNSAVLLKATDIGSQREAFDKLVDSIDAASIAFTSAQFQMQELMTSADSNHAASLSPEG
ncbi:hypothetical protein EGM71_09100 [Stenotrophomonas maltophilia]|nr:hypothetical protein EGM71_09100 [Stenotrophomonas maltophilia]